MGILFDASDDNVTINTQIARQSTANWSISIWYKGTDGTLNGDFGKTLLGRNNGDIFANLVIRSGLFEFIHFNGAWAHNVTSLTSVIDNKFHHLLIANSANATANLYVDGVREATAQSTAISNSSFPYRIDGFMVGFNSQFTGGVIDEITIWDDFLNDSEASILGKSRIRGVSLMVRPSSINSYWQLNDGSDGVTATGSNTVWNRKGTNHGTPNNSPKWISDTAMSYQ